jgi:Secretion system C-terminal sorting domain
MKKLLLTIFGAMSLLAIKAQNCSDIFISEYVEGLSNNKALGIYNPTLTPINLGGNYRLVRYNNGTGAAAGEANSQAIVNLGSHIIAPGEEWVVVIDLRDPNGTGQTAPIVAALETVADTFICPDYNTSYSMYFNGNDALSIQKTTNGGASWSYVDIFGQMGDPAMVSSQSWSDEFPYDGSVGAWWTRNHTLIRKANVLKGVTSNPSPFIVTAEWDSLPVDTFTELGNHSCSCPLTGINEKESNVTISVYPNPVSDESITVSSPEAIESIQIYDVLGKTILSNNVRSGSKTVRIDVAKLNKGIYFIKANLSEGKAGTQRIIIK